MAEKEGERNDLAEGVKRIGDGARRFSKETIGGIAAGITVVVGIAWNDGMKMLFVRLFGPQTTLIAQFGYALFVTVVAVLVGKWAKKHGEQPASSAEQSRGASPG